MRALDDIIPASVAIDNRVKPLCEIGRTLVLAIDESVSTNTTERISFILTRDVRFVVRGHHWIGAELKMRCRFPCDDTTHIDEGDSICRCWPVWGGDARPGQPARNGREWRPGKSRHGSESQRRIDG